MKVYNYYLGFHIRSQKRKGGGKVEAVYFLDSKEYGDLGFKKYYKESDPVLFSKGPYFSTVSVVDMISIFLSRLHSLNYVQMWYTFKFINIL